MMLPWLALVLGLVGLVLDQMADSEPNLTILLGLVGYFVWITSVRKQLVREGSIAFGPVGFGKGGYSWSLADGRATEYVGLIAVLLIVNFFVFGIIDSRVHATRHYVFGIIDSRVHATRHYGIWVVVHNLVLGRDDSWSRLLAGLGTWTALVFAFWHSGCRQFLRRNRIMPHGHEKGGITSLDLADRDGNKP